MTKDKEMISSKELEETMSNYYGTDNWYKHPIFPWLLYTDGVKAFCEKAEAYWFLTDTIAHMMSYMVKEKLKPGEQFFAVYLKVSKKGPADLIITDGDKKELVKHHYKSVSVPAGEWIFFYEYGVLLWHMEH